MLSVMELRKIAKARLDEAEVLLANQQYDGAVYLCGYAVELTLKARICLTLNWTKFPSTPGEFKRFVSFKTHDLVTLLQLSGREDAIIANHQLDWDKVATWDSEMRYYPPGQMDEVTARAWIASSKVVMGAL